MFRKEKDSLGEMEIDENAYYGINTLRAFNNFRIEHKLTPIELIHSIVIIKKTAATINKKYNFIKTNKADAIIKACNEILEGKFDQDFIIPALQGGAGTSTNMNVNEVIANRACEILQDQKGNYDLINPYDDVNKFQSTNDVYPTALKIAAIKELHKLADELSNLQSEFQNKEKEFSDILKIGRTEMQDALPITLGLEFSAYAEAFARDRWRVFKTEERLRRVNIGGTAIGTGINAPKIFIYKIIEELRKETKLGLSKAENSIDATQNADVFAEVSGILKSVSVNFIKISNDIRLLSSGPVSGFAEIKLKPVQTGSSIMPGKINPVIPELIGSIGIQVQANDYAITSAASAGQLELNAFLPVIAYNLIESIKLLTAGAKIFRELCISKIKADISNCSKNLNKSSSLATLLTPYIGYNKVASIINNAKNKNMDIKNSAIELGYFTEEEIDYIFDTKKATSPGIAGSDKLKHRLNNIFVNKDKETNE